MAKVTNNPQYGGGFSGLMYSLSSFRPLGFLGKFVPTITDRTENDFDINGITQTGPDIIDSTKLETLIHEGYNSNPILYSVIDAILTPSLSIPWYVYEVKNQKEFRRYMNHKAAGNWEAALGIEKKAIEIYDGESNLTKLLVSPNEKQTFEQFHQANLGSYLLTGNAYAYGTALDMKSFSGLSEWIPMPGQLTKIIPTGDWWGKVAGYELWLDQFTKVSFDESEVCHVKNYNPNATIQPKLDGSRDVTLGLYGLSPLAALSKVIQQSNDAFIAQLSMIQNGGPIGILSNASNMPVMLQSQKRDGEEKAGEAEQSRYTGARNKGKLRITTANLKYIELGTNSVDLELIPTQRFTREVIASVYHVPLENQSVSDGSSFNNKKEGEKQLWNNAILPPFNILRDHYNRFLSRYYPEIKSGKMFIDYDHHAVPALQQDLEKMNKIVMGQLEHGMIDIETANFRVGNELNNAPHKNKFLLSNNLRFSDEPAPGRTDVNNGKTD